MRASFWEMSASALDFQYRLLRRANASGAVLDFHLRFKWIDRTALFFTFLFLYFLFICGVFDRAISGTQH